MTKIKSKLKSVKTDPGAWDRFEHAVDAAVTSGPKHRMAPKPHKGGKEKPQKEVDDSS